MTTQPTLLTYIQASALLNIPTSTLYALVSRKQTPHIRLSGRIVRFAEDELLAWMRAGHVPAGGAAPLPPAATEGALSSCQSRPSACTRVRSGHPD
jgi:excisionase family DNA binding protein